MDKKIAIVGSGLIGRSWGIVFARAGCFVRLYDPAPGALERAVSSIRSGLSELKSYGLYDGNIDAAVARVSTHTDLADAVSSADYVQENGPEKLEAKRDLFLALDEATPPGVPIATSSSGLKISKVADHLPGKARCLVAHPINPPHLVPCVELSPAEWTDPEITRTVRQLMEAVGQSPMEVKKEIDGFIVNRLQGALLNEALRLAAGGYADPDDIDICVRDGLGLRWSFMGPFETIDLNAPDGIADYGARFGPIYAKMAPEQGTAPEWSGEPMAALEVARRKLLAKGQLNARSVWRDKRLAALAAHKKQMNEQDS